MLTAPYIYELASALPVSRALQRVGPLPGSFCLDAGSRYTFVGANPVATFSSSAGFVTSQQGATAPHVQIDQPITALRKFTEHLNTLPVDPYLPFNGGLVGYVSFEWGTQQSRAPVPDEGEPLPDTWFGLYDTVVIIDHIEQHDYIVSLGLDDHLMPRTELAKKRAMELADHLYASNKAQAPTDGPRDTNPDLTPVSPRRHYRDVAQILQQHLQRGEAQRLNLAQRYVGYFPDQPWAIHDRLRADNPTPYSIYMNPGNFQLCSASPTCFLALEGDRVIARPVLAGQRRTAGPIPTAHEIIAATPEATGVLHRLRTELAPFAVDGSLRQAEPYVEADAQAYHLSCELSVQLKPQLSFLDALAMMVPALSMTGYPKQPAIELLAKHEPFARHAYTGALGYWSPQAKAQFNLGVRLLTIQEGLGYLHAASWLDAESDTAATLDATDQQVVQFFSRLYDQPITTIHEQSLY